MLGFHVGTVHAANPLQQGRFPSNLRGARKARRPHVRELDLAATWLGVDGVPPLAGAGFGARGHGPVSRRRRAAVELNTVSIVVASWRR